jgi:predicted HAD superfamily Cof-like phosphohydrolase
MIEQLGKVEEFHKAFGVPVNYTPVIPDDKTIKLRYELALEELDEFLDACRKKDKVAIFDALVDQLYILLGTAHAFGFGPYLEEGFAEVHRSNMTKLDETGRPVYREDGKVIKSPLYEKPDLVTVLHKQ